MVAKLILSVDGVQVKEYPLTKERVTIGRKSSNDIVIDNLGVSGEHAAVVTILQDSFLEDLNSTNGLSVNGVPTKKHFMQNNDEIEIGKHALKYVTDQVSQTTAEDFEKTMVLRAPVRQDVPVLEASDHTATLAQTHVLKAEQAKAMVAEITDKLPVAPIVSSATASSATAGVAQTASVQILTGPNAGKELELLKSLTTLGKPGVQVAVLARRPSGYFITHVEGDSFPTVNGQVLNEQPRQLNDHDVIELAGVKMEFFLKA
jgi:pSer/pThr/pTyr-binding forkhead associated (FHA) protein